MYRVIKFFTDLEDANHAYEVGDTYPREGLTVSDARIAYLASDSNRQYEPVIEKVEEEKPEEKPEKKPATKRKKE